MSGLHGKQCYNSLFHGCGHFFIICTFFQHFKKRAFNYFPEALVEFDRKTSIPGDVPFFILFTASRISALEIFRNPI